VVDHTLSVFSYRVALLGLIGAATGAAAWSRAVTEHGDPGAL
jgi:hypothetical protein